MAAPLVGALAISGAAFAGSQVKKPENEQRPVGIPEMIGVMEDGPYMEQVAEIFNLIKKTVYLSPNNWKLEQLHKGYMEQFDRDMAKARENGLSVILQLYIVRGFKPPVSPAQQRGLCDVGIDLIKRYPEVYGIEVGLEPNNDDFRHPQFVNGKNVSAGPYTNWLATCYDKFKKVKPELVVFGGGLASKGEDDPTKPNSSTSPTLFIEKMCQRYEESGRTEPLMDGFDMHSYQTAEPATKHPDSTTITIGDIDKLNRLLECFSGKNHKKPFIIWGETGYESDVEKTNKSIEQRYKGKQPKTAPVLEEDTQGRYIAQQMKMAACQPNVAGLINFLLVDEPKLEGWQSGLEYAQDIRLKNGQKPESAQKDSWKIVQKAAQDIKIGKVNC